MSRISKILTSTARATRGTQTYAGKKFRQKVLYRNAVTNNRVDKILNQLNIMGTDRAKIERVIRGKSQVGSKVQLDRVRGIEKQVKDGTFNLKRRIQGTSDYKQIRHQIPKSMETLSQTQQVKVITDKLYRDEFYRDNETEIIQYNSDELDQTGKDQLSNKWNEYKDELKERQSEVQFLLGLGGR